MPRRRLSDAEKLARKAERLNAQAARQAREEAPLFQEQALAEAPRLTAAELYWKGRRDAARAAEHMGKVLGGDWLGWLKERRYIRLAREHLSPERFAEAWGRRQRLVTYGAAYCLDCWYQVLKDVVPGFQEAVREEVTRQEPPPHQPDDGGVWERLQAVFARSNAGREG
jgi:hypothetical protein